MSIRVTLGILQLLETAGDIDSFNPNIAQPAWVGSEGLKPKPDRLVTALVNGGRDPNPSYAVDWPSVQLLIRGLPEDYTATFDKALDIKRTLLGQYHVSIGGELWSSIRLLGDIAPAGTDEDGRYLFSMNLEIIQHSDALGNRADIT